MINVAINGFGRIGRLVLRAGINDKKINFIAINDLTDAGTLAHLLRYDSVHGKFNGTISNTKNSLTVNGNKIQLFSKKDPSELPWKSLKVDLVFECTGIFRTYDKASLHLKAGAKKVMLSAPSKGDTKVKTIVMGVNEKTYKGEVIVSNASCTTNCFAPMTQIINDNFKIIDGVMTTVHAYTADQRIVDSPHSDLRRGKAAAQNIVPTSTGAAKAIGEVIPKLSGKIIGAAVRVPVPDGSLCHFVAEVKNKSISTEKVNALFKKLSRTKYKGIIEYSNEALVSTDIIGDSHSCIFDSQLTEVIGNNIIVVGWYDNEWGYSNRMVDCAKYIFSKIK